MPRFYIKLLILLTFILLIPLIIVIGIGMAQPQTLGLQGFTQDCENQPQPCWYAMSLKSAVWSADTSAIWSGEKPSVQLVQGYLLLLTAKTRCRIQVGYYIGERGSVSTNTVSVSNCGIRVGDILAYFGEPDNVNFEVGWSYEQMVIRYLFDKGMAMEVRPNLTRSRLFADTFVQRMSFRYCSDAGSDCEGFPWHGFLSGWDYCQLEPDQYRCASILATPLPPPVGPLPTLPPG